MDERKKYISIDLKSYYASVECIERGLNPLDTNLVVADESRTEKTICLAVSPSLRAMGIPGRARLFEVIQSVKEINKRRRRKNKIVGSSYSASEISRDPSLAVSYLVARPQMGKYMDISSKIYNIYLKYVSPEDIHVYSIDEVFIDVTNYLSLYKCSAYELTLKMIKEVLKSTGITATAGIGTNLYLCKIAMDIMAKKMPADKDGVRIAELDEMSYRQQLWDYKPITSFWRVGSGYADKLNIYGISTMGDVALCSVENEELLYKLFGVNAELLIDHAWGWETCSISDVKAYRPQSNSLSSGQVLTKPYSHQDARVIVHEMIDSLVLDLVEKRLVTDQIVLDVGYDVENLSDPEKCAEYKGEVITDHYGRKIPKYAHGTIGLDRKTSSTYLITLATLDLFDKIVDPKLTVRRITVTACDIVGESDVHNPAGNCNSFEQLDIFTDYKALEKQSEAERLMLKKERAEQEAIINIRKKHGKNAVLKGMNYFECATGKDRNHQIGGHKA